MGGVKCFIMYANKIRGKTSENGTLIDDPSGATLVLKLAEKAHDSENYIRLYYLFEKRKILKALVRVRICMPVLCFRESIFFVFLLREVAQGKGMLYISSFLDNWKF